MAFDADSIKLARRGLLAGGGALGLTGVLAACGADDSEDAEASTSGSWSFTDDTGEAVELESIPANIVAFTGMAAALYDYGITPVGIFGPTTQAGNLPVDDLEVLGETWGEFDIEKYAGLDPTVLVTHYYLDPASMWYVPDESAEEITQLAPTVLLNANDGTNTLDDVIARHAELAESLGADLESDAVVSAKERYDAAVETLRTAAAENPVKVLACSGAAEYFYASNPSNSNDLRFFVELGVDIVVPDNLDEGGYFESLSWENADKYDADLLFLDSRSVALQPDALAEFPTWNALPAVGAGQITGWNSEPIYSYEQSAIAIEALAEAITNAQPLS